VPRERSPVSLLLAVACIALALVPAGVQGMLAYDRHAILSGEIWRLWSGHLVHFSWKHALADGIVLCAMARLAEQEFGSRRLACTLAVTAPVISLVLLAFVPALFEYRGASALAVLVGVIAAAALWRDERWHAFVILAASTYVLKTIMDALSADPVSTVLPAGVSVSWQAHACGAIAGAVAVFVLGGHAAGQRRL
jgi:rhomboid family GlyGly-CTERM serine protease